MADANGPNWKDGPISEAYDCSPQTVENVRRRFVTNGLEQVVNGVRRKSPPTPKKLDGRQEAEIIALRLGVPPKGYSAWTLRLLARKAVELEIADSVSHETVRKTLKKTALTRGTLSIG
jgi:transposase